MYAILGVTGQVGGAAAQTLLSQGQAVRVIVRDAAKGKEWADRGAEVAVADMNDSEALEKALTGVEGAYVMVPPAFYPQENYPETRGVIAALKKALTAAKVPKIVVLSSVGSHRTSGLGVITQTHILEQELSELDLARAYVRAAWFMDNAQWDIEMAREGKIINCLYPLDRKIPMVSTIDIGEVVAKTLQEHWQGERIIELEGPEEVSPEDIANTFARLLNQPVEAVALPREQWEAFFIEQGGVPGRCGGRAEMVDGFNANWIVFEGNSAEHVKGHVTLEQSLAGLLQRSAGLSPRK